MVIIRNYLVNECKYGYNQIYYRKVVYYGGFMSEYIIYNNKRETLFSTNNYDYYLTYVHLIMLSGGGIYEYDSD